MKKYKSVILVLLSVLVALTTSFLTYRWLQQRNAATASRQVETVNVAVAVTDLGWGTIIKPEMVKIVPFLKGSLTAGFFSDQAAVAGRVVITPIKADEPIFDSRLASSDITKGGVAAVISQNKRAMAVRVDKVKGVSGFIHPGNRVDVVATFRMASSPMPISVTVLENIPVLAVGTETGIKGKQEKPVQVDVITVEVSPAEAEVLALASEEGKLNLSLRNFSDTKDIATKGTTVQSLIRFLSGKGLEPERKGKIRKPITKVAAAQPAKETLKEPVKEPVKDLYSNVQLIEGHKVNELKFKEGGE